jgi:pyruvate dehydrogenase E2 component (dihydrolipoamide acetyltransferase)
MAEIRMPKMGDGMEEGTINVWHKKVGDQIKSGEVIAEIETDKANVEITSYETGVLSQIVVNEGGTVPVGEVIAIVGEPSAAGNGTAKPTPTAAPEPAKTPTNGGTAPAPTIQAATPVAPVAEAAPVQATGRLRVSPLAKRMAEELGINLAEVSGTGESGAIKKRDIEAFQEKGGATVHPLTPTQGRTVAAPAAPTLAGTDTKPSKMREAIARRVLQSKQNIPHFYVSMLIEMDRAQTLLNDLNEGASKESKITVNDIIVKACAIALGRVPEVNATWTPDGMVRRYAEAHIGIAVGIDEGLIIPVVRDCQAKTLRQISAEAKALIGKARNGQLQPAEYSGGTFSVSNLGMMGVAEFTAIINPPEAAILAIGGISRDVVVNDDDSFTVKSRMTVTISADHRLLDGVVAARFLQEVKKALESPFSLLS